MSSLIAIAMSEQAPLHNRNSSLFDINLESIPLIGARANQLQQQLESKRSKLQLELKLCPAEPSISIDLMKQHQARTDKEIVVFFGLPGVGKTTQVLNLARHLKVRPWHLGRYSKSIELPESERNRINQQRASGQLLTGLSEKLVAEALQNEKKLVLFDGFPRSAADAKLLFTSAQQQGYHRIRVVYLVFTPGQEVAESLKRQISRHLDRHGAPPPDTEIERYLMKIERAIEHDLSALQELASHGCELNSLHVADSGKDLVAWSIGQALDLGLEIEWLEEHMQQIEQASQAAQLSETMISCGLVYRAFFNDRYGPARLPVDIHAGVNTAEEGVRLAEEFRSMFPGIRFKARPLQYLLSLQLQHNFHELPLVEAQFQSPCVWLQAGVLLKDKRRTFVATKACLADLRAGILRIDEGILTKLNADLQKETLDKASLRVGKLLQEYPALKLEGILAEHYGDHHLPKRFIKSEQVQKISKTIEESHGGRSHWENGLLAAEIPLAKSIVQLIRSLPSGSQAQPIPKETKLPGILGDLQASKLVTKDSLGLSARADLPDYRTPYPAPQGFSSWLHYMSQEATDGQFREWLINQTKSKDPFCGKDVWLDKILTLNLTEDIITSLNRDPANVLGVQKQTHQGLPLSMHLLWTTIGLETNSVLEQLKNFAFDAEDIKSIVSGMRIGALSHDVGKLLDNSSIETPGVHQVLGARIWYSIKPDWI
ncbi:MAG: AAA family ATPase, partial [Bdellovibrionales bacterium]|nr:AAA family ATPase [Bdellovibrionales bacterium]